MKVGFDESDNFILILMKLYLTPYEGAVHSKNTHSKLEQMTCESKCMQRHP